MTAASLDGVPVLMYHQLADPATSTSRFTVSPDVFAAQLACLRDEGFTTITAGELAAVLADSAGELPRRPVVLTFDDGYGDFYSEGLPLLKQHGFTGTIFVTTDWIGETDAARHMLSWEELAEAARAGIEIGAHTCKHPRLDQMREKPLRDELSVSRRVLEDRLGVAVRGLAYPFGHSNRKVRRVARELGYSYGYTVGNELATSAACGFALPRLTVRRATTMDDFRRMVNGQDTMLLRRDRLLTKGFSVVRRVRSTIRR